MFKKVYLNENIHKNPSNNFILAKKLLSDYKMQSPT